MSDPLLAEAPPPPPSPPPPSHEFDGLSIPPLDPLFLNSQNHHPSSSSDDLDFVLDDNCDFDISVDDLYLLSENEAFFLPSENPLDDQFGNFCPDLDGPVKVSASASPDSGSSGISGNPGLLNVESYLNYSSSPQNSGNRSSNSNSNEFSGRPVSSVGSEISGSGVSSDNTNAPSPDSGNLVVDQKIKMEEVSKMGISKRKKENEDMNNELRSNKYRKSSSSLVNESTDNDHNLSEEDVKRKARLMRNRESAQLSRQRKKHYVEELEDKVRAMHSTITDLNGKISFFMAENASLRQQLSGVNAMAPPPPGMYPPPAHMAAAPMSYGWMPCAPPYMVKPQGSQVPLVPIPRLKPQQPAAAAPARAKKSNGSKSKKDSSRTKKVASVSFLGLLFFMLLFGGLVPFVDVKFGGIRDGVSGGYFSGGSYNQHRGRVLTVNGYSNGSDENTGTVLVNGRVGIDGRIQCERGFDGREKESQPTPGSDEFILPRNASEPLVASLYVPRNDKLVKIDGNLIIHSVLASEKAMASHDVSKENNKKETGLAIPKAALAIPDVRGKVSRHPHIYRNPSERQRAISSGSADALKDQMKSSAADGKLQQWFREGLAGPLLSSGMCTEVFQFDVSPASAPGAIIPVSSVANMTVEDHQNGTHVNKGKNRRILHPLPIPLTNITGKRKGQKESFAGNKTASSMVVSVLVDPREAGDGDIDGMIAPKSLSRIFVVVLVESVKYATYSCVLPRSGPHLVTT